MPFIRSFFLPVFLFLFIPASLLAQKKGWKDVVYLKNGSIIRGQLQESPSPTLVRIETAGQNLFVFKQEDVERVAREFAKTDFKYPYTRGYQNITDVGISVGYKSRANDFSDPGRSVDVTLQTFNGYQFMPALAVGLTTAIDTYGSLTLLPVALGIRGDITKTKVRPYYGLDAGYALDWLSNPHAAVNQDGGFLWSPTLGLKFNSQKTHAFILNLGYRNQKATAETRSGNMTITQHNHYQRILFRAGISF
ncbi:hypothetical protein F0145_01340 [Adhaeribacter rhizoryzae]|uniref:Outer membrane protein beta-barrel domain-containing protein n=2 Tax=Adhaeribacter rhizoryzae TaxID=2607907 RepID=A0A5M6DP34_9BACT|nr:hypothetical protein F0145_01340 [Adhaeribacter rhizoryzae]